MSFINKSNIQSHTTHRDFSEFKKKTLKWNQGYFCGLKLTAKLSTHSTNLYASQEATVRTGHAIMDYFGIGKAVCQGGMLSPCLFNLYAENIMQNSRLDEAEIKISRRNISNLRYADDSTLMAGSEEEIKSQLMMVKEESEKAGLKLNIQKMKIMASDPINFVANRWRNNGNSEKLYFPGLQNCCGQ